MDNRIREILGPEADDLLSHQCQTIARTCCICRDRRSSTRWSRPPTGRSACLRNLQTMFDHGRLAGTGYLSILPVDQGIEHSAGASFAPNPIYFDPENIVKLAVEGQCNAVASTLGVLGAVSRKYAHKIPFIVKLNHNELLSYPNTLRPALFASVDQAFDLGAVAVGATIYYGSEESRRQIEEISAAFAAGARAGHVHGALGVPAERAFHEGWRELRDLRRSDRAGEPSGGDDRSGYREAEAANEQRRLQGLGFRQDAPGCVPASSPPTTPST